MNEDYKKVLGQILHHLGVEIELKSIDIHNSSKVQGEALNFIGQVLKGNCDEEELILKISTLLNVNMNNTHILELAQELICDDWRNRIELIRNRK